MLKKGALHRNKMLEYYGTMHLFGDFVYFFYYKYYSATHLILKFQSRISAFVGENTNKGGNPTGIGNHGSNAPYYFLGLKGEYLREKFKPVMLEKAYSALAYIFPNWS